MCLTMTHFGRLEKLARSKGVTLELGSESEEGSESDSEEDRLSLASQSRQEKGPSGKRHVTAAADDIMPIDALASDGDTPAPPGPRRARKGGKKGFRVIPAANGEARGVPVRFFLAGSSGLWG
jgi:hypothetical protein